MIANALLHLLSSPPSLSWCSPNAAWCPRRSRSRCGGEAAAVVDRYATGTPGSAAPTSGPVTRSRCPSPARTGTRRSWRTRPVRRPSSQRRTPSGLRTRPAFLPRRAPGPAGGGVAIETLLGRLPRLRLDLRYPRRAARPGLPQTARPAGALEPIDVRGSAVPSPCSLRQRGAAAKPINRLPNVFRRALKQSSLNVIECPCRRSRRSCSSAPPAAGAFGARGLGGHLESMRPGRVT